MSENERCSTCYPKKKWQDFLLSEKKVAGLNLATPSGSDWIMLFWPSMLKKSGLKRDEIVIEFKFWCEFERGGLKGA